jgi:hypothetical protein
MKLSIIETPQFSSIGVKQKIQIGITNTKNWIFTPFVGGHKVYFDSYNNFKTYSLL